MFSFSQTKHSSIPISKLAGLQVSNVPIHILPNFDIESALASDTCDDCGDLIGWDIPQSINFVEQSSNELIDHDGQQYLVRRLKVTAISAGGLKAYFSEFTLQPNDKIYFYNDSFTNFNGGFAGDWNREDLSFISDDVIGDNITIEFNSKLVNSPDDLQPINLEIKGFIFLFKTAIDFNDSKSCHQNVVCQPRYDEYCNVMRSVVKTRRLKEGVQGFFRCSGTLLNNTNEDFDPLILTAEHCTRFPRDMNLWEVYFNFQSQTCDPSTMGNDQMRMTGVTRIGRDDGDNVSCPDFAMLRTDNPIPIQYNAFFAGWNMRAWSSLPDNKHVIGIHHPRGDVKKMTYGWVSNPGFTSCIKAHWRHGTGTEGGSSGSPIFLEETKEYIGALSWGTEMKCDGDNNDYYSYLHKANGSITSPLNPDGIDALAFRGIDPISACQPLLFFNGIAFPGSDWQQKKQIEIQAQSVIIVAQNGLETIISNSPDITAPATLPVANSDYVFKAGQRIIIEPGFRINAPRRRFNGTYAPILDNGNQNRVSFRIEPCTPSIPECGINHAVRIEKDSDNEELDNDFTKDLLTINIYPNPATNTLELNFESTEPIAKIVITNFVGQTIFTSEMRNTTLHQKITLPTVSAGIYSVSVSSKNGKLITEKLIVN
jgi:V8-like Glu-specific endopeptidase